MAVRSVLTHEKAIFGLMLFDSSCDRPANSNSNLSIFGLVVSSNNLYQKLNASLKSGHDESIIAILGKTFAPCKRDRGT